MITGEGNHALNSTPIQVKFLCGRNIPCMRKARLKTDGIDVHSSCRRQWINICELFRFILAPVVLQLCEAHFILFL